MDPIVIITTKADHSAPLFINNSLGKKVSIKYYEDLKTGKLNLEITRDTKLILRDPYNTGTDYSAILKIIVKEYPQNIALDYKVLSNFPNYEDKFFQSDFFKSIGLLHPKTAFINNIDELSDKDFPLLMKKRISSRNKGNFIVKNVEDIQTNLKADKIEDFIFQSIIKFDQDIRVIILKNEVLGAIEREISQLPSKFMVKAKSSVRTLPESILKDCLLLAKKLGADLLGVDLLRSGNEYYFIEANISPQFAKFNELTSTNIAGQILSKI